MNNRLTNHVAIMNLQTLDWAEGNSDFDFCWDYEGAWPRVDALTAGVEFDGKLLLFGGCLSPGIVGLKFSPYC